MEGTQVPAQERSGNKGMKMVYTIVENKSGRSFWTRVGAGFVNRDGSINLRLDALPVSGTLQIRDYEPDARGRDGAPSSGPRGLAAGKPASGDLPF